MEVNRLETIWFSNNTPSPKVAHFMKNDRACAYYSNNKTFKGLTLIGRIDILEDDESKQRLWRQGFEIYYPKGITGPNYCVLKYTPQWTSYYHNGLHEFYL
jgi:general stress protein 26